MSFLLDIVVNPCETLDILKIAYFIRNILDLAFIVIPIILVVILSFDLVKNVVSGDEGAQRKNFNIFIKRIIFTVVVFFVPTFVRFTMDFVGDGLGVNMSGYLKCLNVTMGDVKDLVSVEKAKCTSQGWEWNDKMEICNSKIEASETAKKLVEELKEINSSSSKYSSIFAGGSSSLVAGDYSGLQLSSLEYPAAEAGLLMALPGRTPGSDGTEIYQYIFRSVLNQYNYRSCSEGVAAAIRWSGTDDSFPPGGPTEQANYAASSPKWVSVTWGGDSSKLQPGDVFICKNSSVCKYGHTFMYVGNELARKYFPDAKSSYNALNASYNDDPKLAEPLCAIERNDLTDSKWQVFRNIKRETNSKYAGITYSKK